MSAGPAAPSVNRFHLAPFQKALFEPRPTRRKYITTVNLFARRRGPLLITRVRPSGPRTRIFLTVVVRIGFMI